MQLGCLAEGISCRWKRRNTHPMNPVSEQECAASRTWGDSGMRASQATSPAGILKFLQDPSAHSLCPLSQYLNSNCTDTETIPHGIIHRKTFGCSGIIHATPRSQDLDSPLQFLAILNMLAALVYISQASSTRVLPLECSRNVPEARRGGDGSRAKSGIGNWESWPLHSPCENTKRGMLDWEALPEFRDAKGHIFGKEM